MPKFNVLVGVVEVLDAEDEVAGIQELEKRLQEAGFDTYHSDGPTLTEIPHAFESRL